MKNDNKTRYLKCLQTNPLRVLQFHDFAEVESGYGFSLYRGVFIGWDEDYDPRILRLVDEMLEVDRHGLIGVMETKGNLFLLWKNLIPHCYGEGKQIELLRDVWSIQFSENLDQDTDTH